VGRRCPAGVWEVLKFTAFFVLSLCAVLIDSVHVGGQNCERMIKCVTDTQYTHLMSMCAEKLDC
jgi:hypothetical protein